MYSREILVTPEMAENWLKNNNLYNRRVAETVVKRYADDMRRGNWQLNGEAIQFSCSGQLKNGQHRLRAVIMAGIPVRMYVTFEVPDDANVYDMHRKRDESNIAQLAGIDIGKCEMSICRFLCDIVNGKSAGTTGSGQLIKFVRDEVDSLKEAKMVVGYNSIMVKASCHAAAWTMLKNNYDYNTMRRFFEIGASGFYNKGEESAIALRNMIIARAKTFNNTVERRKLFKATCKALSDFEEGKSRKIMYRDSDFENYDCYTGSNAEQILKKYF